MNQYSHLAGIHDLTLPDWGPYAHDLFTTSHITNREKGFKLDFFMVPALLRRGIFPPDTLRECGYTPWEASDNLQYYSARQQLVGKDLFYSETSYSRIDDTSRLGRIEFVNNTDEPQNAALFIFARFAPKSAMVPLLPQGSVWLDAVNYDTLAFARMRPDHNVVFCGARRAIEEVPGTVGGRCIGNPHINLQDHCFGAEKGDTVTWKYKFTSSDDARIFLRAKIADGKKYTIEINVDGAHSTKSLDGTGAFDVYEIFAGRLDDGGTITLTAASSNEDLRIDGLALTPACAIGDVNFDTTASASAPHSAAGPLEHSTVISGEDGSHFVWWSRDAYEREYNIDGFVNLLNYSYAIRHPNYRPSEILRGQNARNASEYIKESYILPITVPSKGSSVIYAIFAEGSEAPKGVALDDASLEAIYAKAHKEAFALPCVRDGEPFRFSQQLMSAALMTNVLFPIQCMGKNIRHHSPDKFFNSLYTWDSGFIGLGMLELDKKRAIENLNVYVTEPEDENAFVNHGTPLPVQAYLYQEIWNRHQDRDALEYFYPRLMHFYNYLAGHIPTSTTDKYKTHLLATWDIFYNTGGWDDIPPQWALYRDHTYMTTPAVTSSHAIRFAKILRAAARLLGKTEDLKALDCDIALFSQALLKYAWSEEDGIFSYVTHNQDGTFKEFYRDPESGVNFNFTFDGVVPLVAGICDSRQSQKLWQRLESPEHLWTPFGLTAVDQSAPYYSTDGYWNGAIWMPHQWFFWKSALDCGKADFARRIAMTGLKVWKHETDQSYYTFEHFSAINGRGCGCHHFGALSSPVLSWFHAYFTPGRLTTGMDCWILSKTQDEHHLTAELHLDANAETSTLLYVPTSENPCTVRFNDEPVEFQKIDGVLEITLPGKAVGTLSIEN
ncbi:MAG: hypothetical protein MJ106_00295 [Lentisphaeria bacterium]|nr:hypothetical protein [Lentisphaeria bacterium]